MSLVLTSERAPAVQSVEVRPHTPILGATVTGLDLSRDIDTATAARLRQALRERGVLFFRDQRLNPRRFLEVAGLFGEPLRHNPYIPSVEEHSGVEIIESGGGKRVLANEAWHADVTWRPDPPKATALYAVELPPLGGDTVWTSSTGAYASLDPLLAAYLETLTAVNFVDASGHARSPGRDERLDELRAKYPPIDVPVIKTHPETGQKYIFVTELHTTYIKGVSRTTSESLLRLLSGVLSDPVLHARFSWRPGSLAIWDNRLVQHRAIHDYGDQRRVLYRATLA
ncbi:TauD/TfdA dioxygenase family protein [Sorangium sp. So ce131]|uniref:TauD/TfdA dioxygenase family protein n=1 Tax=Sorangium sp. So ce131 TaxID=3133282 RepID=UPI003F614284